jgi:competence protein ComEA
MFGKLLLIFCLWAASWGPASALDVNSADQAALQTIKGLGPAKSAAIVADRDAHGAFKNPEDLAERIKGLGPKAVARLQSEGLTIGSAGASAQPASKAGKTAAAAVRKGAAK